MDMDPKLEKMLKEILDISRENAATIKQIRRVQRNGQILKFAYWLIVLGFAFGAFYFVQPYVGSLLNIYGSSGKTVESIKDVTNNVKSLYQ